MQQEKLNLNHVCLGTTIFNQPSRNSSTINNHINTCTKRKDKKRQDNANETQATFNEDQIGDFGRVQKGLQA